MPKSINDTFIYKNMDSGKVLTNNILRILKEGRLLTAKDLEEQIIVLNRYKFPLKSHIMQEFQKGNIRVVVPPINVKLPTYMPFFLTKDKGNIVAIIDGSVYGNVRADGRFDINTKKLYCMMEGAYLSFLYYRFENTMRQKGNLLIRSSSIYSNLFIRPLNRDYAININKDRMHKLIFLASKFFLINVMGLTNGELIFNYAIKNLNGDVSMLTIQELDEVFPNDCYKDFASFVQGVIKYSNDLNLGLETLTVRSYLEAFITMYDSSMILALEYYPYLLYNIISVINGGYINNQKLIEQVIERDGASLYKDIISLAR